MKHTPTGPRATPLVDVLAVLLLLGGAASCQRATQGDTAAASGSDSPCVQYADRLCKEMGNESSDCKALRADVALLTPRACAAALTEVEYSLGKLAERRKVCTELTEKLCKDLGEQTQSCAMVRRETPNFPVDRCSGMMEQYDRLLADLRQREERDKPLDDQKQAAIATGKAPSFGPADAKVTVVEFSDFECPYCSKAAATLDNIKKKYPDSVRFVFRQFPLTFHKNAHLAAQASLAAEAGGKFWEYQSLLFANQRQLQREHLEKYAGEVGLDVAKLKEALDAKTYAAQVDADMELGNSVGVTGTPTLFINGLRVQNPTDFDLVASLIDKAKQGGSGEKGEKPAEGEKPEKND